MMDCTFQSGLNQLYVWEVWPVAGSQVRLSNKVAGARIPLFPVNLSLFYLESSQAALLFLYSDTFRKLESKTLEFQLEYVDIYDK